MDICTYRKLKIIIITLLIWHFHSNLNGQQNIDSLKTLLKTGLQDTIKLGLRAQIGEEIPVLRISYWDSIRTDAERLHLKKYEAQAINNMGYVYDDLGNLSKAVEYYKDGLKIREEIGDQHGIAESLNNIAIAFSNQGDIPNSLDYHFRALKVQEGINDQEGISLSLNNIAYLYETQSEVAKALEYYQKSLQIAETIKSKDRIATELNNIGLVYRTKANDNIQKAIQDSIRDIAMENFQKALVLFKELNDIKGVSTIYMNIGTMFNDERNYSKAMEYYNKSLDLCEKAEDKRGIASCLNYIGGLYLDEKNYNKALNYGKRALVLVKELGYPSDIKTTAKLLSDTYEMQQKWSEAFTMQTLYYAMRDSTNNESTRKASLKKQFQYEYEKKEALLNAEKEKERLVAQEKSRKQRIIIWSIVGGLVMVAVFAAFVYRSLRITRKQKKVIEVKNKETEVQKKIIEEKNKDITDSINYARRIQQARLPEKEEIHSIFPESFVLFKPKDIVSGDFYFIHRNNRSVFLAAADCTGHGVPGAFMSLIGSEKLSEAISVSSDTSEILMQLNVGIKNSLHQSENIESTRDGMDIALCSVDTGNRIVRFAGANRPIWIIRKDQATIEEITGTKKAIGGFTEDNQSFETHEIALKQGDSFYIFSDGYADTCNGCDGKKLKTKKFKEILVQIRDKEMRDQGVYLDEFIENWKSGSDQIDDILVVGVRL